MIGYPQTKSNKLYSWIADFYDIMLWVTGYKLAIKYFIRLLPFEKNRIFKVLDAGCGTGLYSFAVLDKFPDVEITAFDLEPAMVANMNKAVQKKRLENKVRVYVGDVTKSIPENYEQFDLVVTGGILEYVDITAAVKNLSQYLKKGGYFLNSPVKDSVLGIIVGRLYRFKPYSRSTNVEAFTKNGFILKQTRSFPIVKEAHLFQKV